MAQTGLHETLSITYHRTHTAGVVTADHQDGWGQYCGSVLLRLVFLNREDHEGREEVVPERIGTSLCVPWIVAHTDLDLPLTVNLDSLPS